jgi:hypothetical protein
MSSKEGTWSDMRPRGYPARVDGSYKAACKSQSRGRKSQLNIRTQEGLCTNALVSLHPCMYLSLDMLACSATFTPEIRI